MTFLDLFYGVFTFWVCLGTVMFFLLSITELFRPFRSFYDQCPGFSALDGLIVVPVAVLLWPISLACIVENVRGIRRDARIRHQEHLDQKRQDLHKRACEFMIARASTIKAESISAGTITADHLFERTTKLNR